ncbi:hypothetical protein BKA61DRAFT_646952 [Leptodontidium sp. MPI-SDFR-AT-0119]|nr:hypothetical protein BKA61DRAFT_646952 [Leptodontidium sp. MPI-SDFR-AT-0119]
MIGVFPASGGIGGSTLKHLLNNVSGSNVTGIVRKPENVPQNVVDTGCNIGFADYDKHRSKAHKAAIDAAHKSEVSHIFYSSFAFAGDGNQTSVVHVMQAHLDREKCLASLAANDSSFTYTVVRIGLYTESCPFYTAFFDLKNPSSSTQIPHDGISWAKQDELGEAAALLMASYVKSVETFPHVNKTIVLSGPRAVTLQEIVETLERVLKKDVQLKEVSIEYAEQPSVKEGKTYGAGDLARVWASVFEAIRLGEAATLTQLLTQTLGESLNRLSRLSNLWYEMVNYGRVAEAV